MNRQDPADARLADYGTFPARPGWWIQWDGRHDWFPVSASFAAWVVPEMRDGDRLVLITPFTPQEEAVA